MMLNDRFARYRRSSRVEALEQRIVFAGYNGPALSLDGVNDYASAADHASLDLGTGDGEDFTVEGFFYVPDANNDNLHTIVSKNNAYQLSINFNPVSADFIFLNIWSFPGSLGRIQLGVPLQVSTGWHHIAAVFDNESTPSQDLFAIYLDGQRLTFATNVELTPGIFNSTSALNIGAFTGAGSYTGFLDDVRLSNSARYTGPSYTVPQSPFTTDENTRALWHFDEAPGSTTFVDASVNGNTAEGINGAKTAIPVTLPGAPTDLFAAVVTPARVQLAWSDNSTNETGFAVSRSTNGMDFVPIATLSAGSVSYADEKLESNVSYSYRVQAFNEGGNSPSSNTAEATPLLQTLIGGNGSDTYHVRRAGTQIHIYVNTPPVGEPTYYCELAALGASLTINTLAGDDTLTVATNGQPSLGINQLVFNSGSGDNSLQLTEGAAMIDSTVDAGSALATTVTGGAQLTTARLNQTGLTLSGAGTKVTIRPDGPLANVLESLTLDATSILDLTNNDLILRATAGTKDAIHADAQAKITSAQNGLDANLVTNWDGPGITSSSARTSNVATGFDLVGLGVIRNSDLDVTTGIPGSTYASFGGVPVTADDVLLKYTYIGDANLNGIVSFDDYIGMDNAFFELIPNLGWATGDVTFDDAINFDDYSKVDQAFFFQGAPLAGGGVASNFEVQRSSFRSPAFESTADSLTDARLAARGRPTSRAALDMAFLCDWVTREKAPYLLVSLIHNNSVEPKGIAAVKAAF